MPSTNETTCPTSHPSPSSQSSSRDATSTSASSMQYQDSATNPDSDDPPQDWSLFDDLVERTGSGERMALQVRGGEEMPLTLALGKGKEKRGKRTRRNGEFDGGKKRRKVVDGEKKWRREQRQLKKLLQRLDKDGPPQRLSSQTASIRSFHRSITPSPSPAAFSADQSYSAKATMAPPVHRSPSPDPYSPPVPSSTPFFPAPPPPPPPLHHPFQPRALYRSSSRDFSLPPDEPLPLAPHEQVERPRSALGLVRVPALAAPPLPPLSAASKARMLATESVADEGDFRRDRKELEKRFEQVEGRFDGLVVASSRRFDTINAPLEQYVESELQERVEAAEQTTEALESYLAAEGEGEL